MGQVGEGGSGRSWHPSSSPPPSDVPSAPLLLTVEHVSDSSVTVSWEPPERPGRLGFQGYVLELLREGGELSPARTGGWAWSTAGTSPQTLPLASQGMQSGGAHMTSGGPYPPAPGSPRVAAQKEGTQGSALMRGEGYATSQRNPAEGGGRGPRSWGVDGS